jgi:hypothetical protein
MTRPLPLIMALSLGAAGCAKSTDLSPIGTGTQSVSVVTSGATQTIQVRQDDPTNTQVIDQPMEAIWRVLPAVYDSLGIAITTVNTTSRVIGADGVKMRRSLKGVPLSRYFDCGATQIGQNADDYEITLTLLTRARAASPTSTRVEVSTVATARPIARRQNPQNCTILGTLDAKLFETLRLQASRR